MAIKNRWPKSIHSQIEAVFHSIFAFHKSKIESPDGLRSSRTWNLYRYECHRFADFLLQHGIQNLLDSEKIRDGMSEFLQNKLDHCVRLRQSRQTFETILSALGKLQHAINTYIDRHSIEVDPLDVEDLRMDFYSKGKTCLGKMSRKYDNRAYPDPQLLIETIDRRTLQLQAALQYEGGLRAEGVGAPANRRFKSNPLTEKSLRGIGIDPVTGLPIGQIASIEKGGKETVHFISVETYRHLERHIQIYGKLESGYSEFVNAINKAAKETGQYVAGRGSHGLKHNFAQRRYMECVDHGMSHEQAMQQTSLETSHFRMRETLSYTRG